MGKHVLKLYGITIVGILVTFIPTILLAIFLQLLETAIFGPEIFQKIGNLDMGAIGTYLVFQLIAAALVATISSFFLGGIYGTAIQAIFEGHTSVGNFFSLGARTYGKMYFFTILSFLLWALYAFMMFALYNIAILTGMVENGTSLMIDIFLFIVFVMLLIISYCSPIYLIKENSGVFHSLILPFKTFGKSLLSTVLSLLVTVGITLVYYLPGALIIGIADISLKQTAMNNLVTNSLLLIINILYFIFVFPLAYSLSVLIIVNRYKNKIRPILFSASAETQFAISSEVPTQYQPSVQPAEPDQLKFTFQLPDFDSLEQNKPDTDEDDSSRFTF